MLPGWKFFGDLDKCGNRGFQVKCVSRYWAMTFRDANGLGRGSEGVYRKEQSRMFRHDLFSPLGMEQR